LKRDSGFSCLFLSVLIATSVGSYGVNAHVTRPGGTKDFDVRTGILNALQAAGVGSLRCALDWSRFEPAKGRWNFGLPDALCADAEKRGVAVLGCFGDPPAWARPVWEHLDDVRSAAAGMARHFGDRIAAYEIWNEQNVSTFWGGAPNPTNYLAVLKAARQGVKSVRPDAKVVLGGLAHVPLAYVEELYRLGGRDCFDAMNVHPYSHPKRPEGYLDVELEKLKALMARYGDAAKPIWLTEIGWPTHEVDEIAEARAILPTALRIARPDQSVWNVVCVAASNEVGAADQAVARQMLEVLPSGSTSIACGPDETVRRLKEGKVDAVVYPFDDAYPNVTADAVLTFVRDGGTLVDLGGFPLRAKGRDDTRTFHLDVRAFWDKDGDRQRYPRRVQVAPTREGAGIVLRPAGGWAHLFHFAGNLRANDRMVPLLSGKSPLTGEDLVGAAVYLLDSDLKGCVVVSSLKWREKLTVGTNDEKTQADYLSRSLGIAFAEGVESFYWFKFRDLEWDPIQRYDCESHFGLVYQDLSPKPAYAAYMNFIRLRPEGSVATDRDWHDDGRTLFCPRWTRPDGRVAGMIWRVDGCRVLLWSESADVVEFWNVVGKRVYPRQVSAGTWSLEVGGSPVFFLLRNAPRDLSVDCRKGTISWTLPDEVVRQEAYELEVDGRWCCRVEDSRTQDRPWPGTRLQTGARHRWRVRCVSDHGVLTPWSAAHEFECLQKENR